MKIVKLKIVDNDTSYKERLLETFYLIDPDESKLAELKRMIERRFDYDGLSDEEIEKVEEMCDDIWGHIYRYIEDNFATLNINETYEISY